MSTPRLSRDQRAAIAQAVLDGIDVTSGREALRRYGFEHDGGPGLQQERRIDEATGLPYRVDIFASQVGDDVHLSVGVWPLPERVRTGGAVPVLGDFITGWVNAPAVRGRLLPPASSVPRPRDA